MNFQDMLMFVLIVNFVIGGVATFSDDFIPLPTDQKQIEAMNALSSNTQTVIGSQDQASDPNDFQVTGGTIIQSKSLLSTIRTFMFGLPTLIQGAFNASGNNVALNGLVLGLQGVIIYKFGLIVVEFVRGFRGWG